jgi:hypothetical protein
VPLVVDQLVRVCVAVEHLEDPKADLAGGTGARRTSSGAGPADARIDPVRQDGEVTQRHAARLDRATSCSPHASPRTSP